MTITCIIVDDEKVACKNLQGVLIKSHPEVKVLGVAHNTKDAENLINLLMPQVVFLDINMPNENAFHFLERIPSKDFEVIFVTAYDEYAIRALKLNAIDYILKPISEDEIQSALDKLTERLKYNSIIHQHSVSYADLLNPTKNEAQHSKITFKDINRLEIVDFKDLYYIEAKASYSGIFFRKGNIDKNITISHSISEYEEMLPTNIFFRIHKSYLVNCGHIIGVAKEHDNYTVSVANKYILPVSRRRYTDLMLFLNSNVIFHKNVASFK